MNDCGGFGMIGFFVFYLMGAVMMTIAYISLSNVG